MNLNPHTPAEEERALLAQRDALTPVERQVIDRAMSELSRIIHACPDCGSITNQAGQRCALCADEAAERAVSRCYCERCSNELEESQIGLCDSCQEDDEPRPMTNTELVTDMMEFSKYGPMAQIFIMDAIMKAADAAAEADPATLTGGMWNMIDPRAWVGVAKEIQARIAERSKG